jgi:clan AA aspartic protease (TIGR02281 family)
MSKTETKKPTMRKFVLAAVAVIIASPACANPVVDCYLTTTKGDTVSYRLVNGDTYDQYIETAYSKNGSYFPSRNPRWWRSADGHIMIPSETPDWQLNLMEGGRGPSEPAVELTHSGHTVGNGWCIISYTPAPKPAPAPAPAHPAPTIQADDLDTPPAGHFIAISTTPSGAMLTRVRVGSSYVTALVDTGATVTVVPQTLGQGLLANGDALYLGEDTFTIADGSSRRQTVIRIKTLQLGQIVLHDVKAAIAPYGADVLLGLTALDKLGRITIDKAGGVLTFVRPGEEGYGE